MAGAVAAGELIPPIDTPEVRFRSASDRRSTSRRYDYRVATANDDHVIRRLLRENPLDGAIRLSFECEPDAFAAASVYGPVHQTIVADDRGRLVGMACRAERDVFVNGRPQRLGYLCQLRIERAARGRAGLLAGGFQFCRVLHEEGSVPAYLVSIVDDNETARRLLASSRLPGAPAMRALESFATFALPTWQVRRLPKLAIERGRPDLIEPIVACLQDYGARHQFAPVWTAGALGSALHTPGLDIEDFLLLRDGRRVTACLARWDQRRFRQTIVRGYSSWLSRGRVAINVAARLAGLPRLPKAGEALSFAYLSHVAFDANPVRMAALIATALDAARADGIDYLVLGLAARHPLASIVRAHFRHRRYDAQLFLAYWPDGADFARALDARVAHPEVATL